MTTVTISDYVAGDTLALDFTLRDVDGDAADLTGAVIKWGVAAGKPGDAVFDSPLLVKSTATSGVTITDAVNGKVAVRVNRGEFTGVGNFVHELEVTLVGGESYTVARGVLRSAAAVFSE